ncbi:hypothetical protein EXU57_10920 [Segetibacter sp. 3557_3]|uniref:PH domain-containing protein n=1 Tax=Segetibacter sp. 3557_3 TaxID=2547429 RepID=UPI0010591306|nr:PH domain-containing protein [Segetibacter sp. 3557_3]TDH26592.1 hypothetical protein EXU57_10920 [Segetibacter sp. 3557_3]
MIFKATPDRLVRTVTTTITIGFLILIVIGLGAFIVKGTIVLFMPAFIVALVYLFSYLYHPVNYEISNGQVIIHRPAGRVAIEIDTIQSCELLENGRLKYSIRTFGVGGLFGYYGKFYHTGIGAMIWYATRCDRAVMIIAGNQKKIILTPDQPEEFIRQL